MCLGDVVQQQGGESLGQRAPNSSSGFRTVLFGVLQRNRTNRMCMCMCMCKYNNLNILKDFFYIKKEMKIKPIIYSFLYFISI